MEKCDSKACLLLNDELDILNSEEGDSDDVGFSSGYDSNTDSLPEVSDVRDQDADSDVKKVVNYKSTSALCDHLKYIVSMPELCDVTFLVGPSKVPVHGVKAILGTRSRVMYQLIIQKQKEGEAERKKSRKSRSGSRLVIDVRKYEPEDFRKIIQFIHCGTIDVTVKNVTGLLCGANQFKLVDLKVACWDFIKRCLKSGNGSVAAIRKNAQKYSHHKVISKIYRHLEHMSLETKGEQLSASSSSSVCSSASSSSVSSHLSSPSKITTTV